MSLISLGYIFTYYFLLISSYSLSHFFSRQALRPILNKQVIMCTKITTLSL
ncbi:hypothetical protein HUB92_04505 [Wolbachia endosymbiont of Wiebesia pumilae]|uniref:hypothetical protein n=1 Tax=Wolbachia endosymbiont of Wiebesia pumilae TaxID=2742717 RepID=UPI001AEB7648|nr:hypothetical protein [Wolbachia endosymbiont of Wiebesia pumilae]QTP62126.1 hypothetical protein HUB92_04505 [Wolbachia endosymbiont of Wiebesia pumilae]